MLEKLGTQEERAEMAQWLRELSDGLCACDKIIDGWKAARCAALLQEIDNKKQPQNPLIMALHRLKEYSVDHPEHDTDQILKDAYNFLENYRDTERLDYLLQFLRIEDVGDDSVVPGVILEEDEIIKSLDRGAILERENLLKDGFNSADMRKIIDQSINVQKLSDFFLY